MSWNKILGQKRIKDVLKDILLKRRIPNALMFYGCEGVGKDAVAIQFAKVLNCDENNFGFDDSLISGSYDSCNRCISCSQFDKLQHPNFKVVFSLPRGKNEKEHDDNPLNRLTSDDINNIKNEIRKKSQNHYYKINVSGGSEIRVISIRDIRRMTALSTNNAKYRVVLVTNAHEMNTEASNSFLKILEEPPHQTLFILTTSKKDNILPTILSRCQDLYFDNLSNFEIETGLKIFFSVEDEKTKLIGQLANGSFSKAIELLDENFTELRANVVNLLRLMLSNKYDVLYDEIDLLLAEKDRTRLEYRLSMLIIWLRDILLLREGLSNKIINVDQIEGLNSFYKKLPKANVIKTIEEIETSIQMIQRNVNLQLIFYNLIINLRKLILR